MVEIQNYKLINLKISSHEENFRKQFAEDIIKGFSSKTKNMSSLYLYDDIGSNIFKEITEIEEYYLTRTEASILKENSFKIAEYVKNFDFNLVELGAGDGSKTTILMNYFIENKIEFEYFPIDISEKAIEQLKETMNKMLISPVKINLICSLNNLGLKWITENSPKKNFVLILGNSLGNNSDEEAIASCKQVSSLLNKGDYFLIGLDLKKDIKTIQLAYDDSFGLNDRFRLNILTRMNKEFGADYDLRQWNHYCTYNPLIGAKDSWIMSLKDQTVTFGEEVSRSFDFDYMEGIFLGRSYKYSLKQIENIANQSGFSVVENFVDEKKFFVDSLWVVK